MQVIHAKDTFEQMRQEVANTDAKIQALHDECARMFKECSDKLEATGQDIISMNEWPPAAGLAPQGRSDHHRCPE